ncbi:MAG: hypothetical protein PHE79_02885 [Eubacteriales bacterium]|nr:hypothetical protein [Eubacteriales bacterium]
MEINIDMKFECPKCKTIINHEYTQKDVTNLTYLILTCQNCGFNQQLKTSIIIDKAKEEAINEFKKYFK